jgi:hypothetical protein
MEIALCVEIPQFLFIPYNPLPPRAGAHRRCIQIIDGLIQIGASVHFALGPVH